MTEIGGIKKGWIVASIGGNGTPSQAGKNVKNTNFMVVKNNLGAEHRKGGKSGYVVTFAAPSARDWAPRDEVQAFIAANAGIASGAAPNTPPQERTLRPSVVKREKESSPEKVASSPLRKASPSPMAGGRGRGRGGSGSAPKVTPKAKSKLRN